MHKIHGHASTKCYSTHSIIDGAIATASYMDSMLYPYSYWNLLLKLNYYGQCLYIKCVVWYCDNKEIKLVYMVGEGP